MHDQREISQLLYFSGCPSTLNQMARKLKTKIFVFNTDKSVLDNVKTSLDLDEYGVKCFTSFEELCDEIAHEAPDLIIIDWVFSGKSGLDVSKKLRVGAQHKDTPIFVLSARGSESDKLKAFEIGVDDYLTIPFYKTELAARIKAILKRANKQHLSDILEGSTIKLDRNSRRVSRNGRDIKLGPTEFNLLEYFMLNRGKVLNRMKILENAWLKDEEIDFRTVDVHVLRLRNALIIDTETDPIRTVRGVGYIFED
ncbi:MAG: winged helix-turn-helix domain-containing protein [Hyphomicrobium sp.]